MSGICNYADRTKKEWEKTQTKIWDYWMYDKYGNERLSLTKRFKDKYDDFDAFGAEKNLKWFIEQRLELPWNKDAINVYTPKHINRIKVEIDSFAKALDGKFSNLAWVVPEGISKQDPVSRRFYNKLNEIINYERIGVNTLSTSNAEIADLMTQAYIHQYQITGPGKRWTKNRGIEKLKDLRKNLAENPDNQVVMNEFIGNIENFINKDKDGVTIKQFHELIHMKTDAYKSAIKPNFKDLNKFKEDGVTVNPDYGKDVKYNPFVYQAAGKARSILDNMGTVYTNGLGTLQRVLALKYANTTNIKEAKNISKTAKTAIEKIENIITDINAGKKKGGYFPHLQFETIVSIKNKLNDAVDASRPNIDMAVTSMVDQVLGEIGTGKLPDSVKRRANNLNKFWEKDPLLVIGQYGHQATQFNKLVNTQLSYLEALKFLPKSDTQFQKGLKRFIDEEFAVFTKGTRQRPDWANRAVTALNSLQTARTMGLNITGAVKNAASALHFYSRVGLGALTRTTKDFNHDGDFRKAVTLAEKEAGFLFTDAAKELYTEGLISKNDFEIGGIKYDPHTGNFMKGTSKVKDGLVAAGNFTLDKALIFHRLTENNQRKWMFRVAFNTKYKYLINSGYDAGKAAIFAKNYGLQTVNSWAYEYAAHAKSKLVRGEGRTVEEMNDGSIKSRLRATTGAASEAGMHLMHYPMSLAESTYSTLKGAHKAFLAGQGFDAPEIQHLMRYAGIAGIVSLTSILTNTNLFNIFEHDTAERVMRVLDDFTEYDNPDKGTFGLMSEFTGTNLGTLKHLMVAGGVLDTENNDLNKILFGNVNFADPDDKQTQLYNAYQYSTVWGQWNNKLYPAIKDGRGRDLVTHWLKLYPTTQTKFLHGKLFGKKPNKKKASTRGMSPDVLASLKLLGSR